MSVEFSIRDVARSVRQGAHCQADDIYLLPRLGVGEVCKELMVLPVRPTPTRSVPDQHFYAPSEQHISDIAVVEVQNLLPLNVASGLGYIESIDVSRWLEKRSVNSM